MKELNKSPTHRPTPKNPAPKSPQNTGFTTDQALQLASTSVDAIKAYSEYQKEAEVTKRALIEGQKSIIQGEQELEKARMEHAVRLNELDNADSSDIRRHETVMKKLFHKGRKLDTKASLQEQVLALLAAQKITAEEAAILLHGAQE